MKRIWIAFLFIQMVAVMYSLALYRSLKSPFFEWLVYVLFTLQLLLSFGFVLEKYVELRKQEGK